MKIGQIENGLEYDLCVHLKNGARYLIRTQYICCVDSNGNNNGSIGMRPQDAIENLMKYGKLSIQQSSHQENFAELPADKISKIHTTQTQYPLPVSLRLEPKKQSCLGKLASTLADRLD